MKSCDKLNHFTAAIRPIVMGNLKCSLYIFFAQNKYKIRNRAPNLL